MTGRDAESGPHALKRFPPSDVAPFVGMEVRRGGLSVVLRRRHGTATAEQETGFRTCEKDLFFTAGERGNDSVVRRLFCVAGWKGSCVFEGLLRKRQVDS